MGTLTNILKEGWKEAKASVLNSNADLKNFADEMARFNYNVKASLKANPELASYVKELGEGSEYIVAKRFMLNENYVIVAVENIMRQYPKYGDKRVKGLALESIMADRRVETEEEKNEISRILDLYFIYRNNHFYETYQMEVGLNASLGETFDAVAAIAGNVGEYAGEKVEQGKTACIKQVKNIFRKIS